MVGHKQTENTSLNTTPQTELLFIYFSEYVGTHANSPDVVLSLVWEYVSRRRRDNDGRK